MSKINNKPILFISDNFPPVIGGSSTVYDQICKNNADKVVALSSSKKINKTDISEYDQNCDFTMYRIKHLRVPQKHNTDSSSIISALKELACMIPIMLTIIKICLKHQVKVVCIGELIYGGWIILFSRYLLRKQTIVYTHGEEISQQADGFYNKHRSIFLQAAHKIISVSLFCKSQIVSLYHISPDKIEIISNGVDINRFIIGNRDQALLETHNILPTDRIILSVGRLVKRKGHHNLIHAMHQIAQKTSNVKLIIIGSGEEENNLNSLVKQLKLDNVVLFLNNIDDELLIHFYQSADVFTMPNITLDDGDTEGFGLVFLEANACGKPVVGGQAGGAIEAIIHNKTGLLVDGYSINEIAQSLLRILDDKALYKNLAQHAYQFAKKNTWIQKADLFADITTQIQTKKDLPHPIFTTSTPASTNNQLKRLHITVDFEEMFDWSNLTKTSATVENIKQIEKFHQTCVANKIQPTYLITYKVLQSDNAVDFLKMIYTGNYEIGIHLHPWNSPPYIEQINSFNSFQCNLPSYLEQLKIENLINLFEEKLDFKPLINRAGRYGCSQQTLDHLKAHNIKIDLSPSSGYNYNAQGGPDFKSMNNAPFWSDINKDLLCFPIPSIFFLKGPDYLTQQANNHHYASNFLKFMLPTSPVRLSPEANDLSRMQLIGTLLNKQEINDFILSVHSTSLYKGGNIYSETEQDTQNNIRNIISYAQWSNENLNTLSATPMSAFKHY